MHNSFWNLTEDEYSPCTVVAYAGEYDFGCGRNGHSKHTYVIEHEGHCYPARHTSVLGALTDAAVKRRLKKAPPPRLL